MKSGRPIIAVADDLSGASELAGIGVRLGLSARVVNRADLDEPSDLTVINTDTRSGSADHAKNILQGICDEITGFNGSVHLFKKVDSLLRGHVLAEAGVMIDRLEFRRALLAPANPSKERIIRNGCYYVGGQLIEHTPFARDPRYPRESSRIQDLVQSDSVGISFRHLSPGTDPPDSGVYSFDITGIEDLENAMQNLQPHELCCGAADAFEVFLKSRVPAGRPGSQATGERKARSAVIINGSTFRNRDEEQILRVQEIPVFTLKPYLKGYRELDQLSENILEQMKSTPVVFLKPGLTRIDKETFAERIEAAFGRLAVRLLDSPARKPFHLYLTGGATAAAVIDRLGYHTFEVVEELFPGVVTLSPKGIDGFVTTKPGSYPWPPSAFSQLTRNDTN